MSERKLGRPFLFTEPKEVQEVINNYLAETEEERITITGLCLALGMSKETFYNYCEKPKFSDVFNNARHIVENSYEISLRKHGRSGDIFALKNFGWKDKQEIDQTIKGQLDLKSLLGTNEQSTDSNGVS